MFDGSFIATIKVESRQAVEQNQVLIVIESLSH